MRACVQGVEESGEDVRLCDYSSLGAELETNIVYLTLD